MLKVIVFCILYLYFAKSGNKNIGKKVRREWNNKYSQKLLEYAKQYATYAIKTASKRAIQKQQKQLII